LGNIERIKYLLQKVAEDSVTPEDMDELISWISTPQGQKHALWVCEQLGISPELKPGNTQAGNSSVIDKILDAEGTAYKPDREDELPQMRRLYPLRKIAVAAAVILLIGSIAFFADKVYLNKSSKRQEIVVHNKPRLILPGSNKAVLTLNNGKQIALDSSSTGLIANDGDATVQKQAGGQLKYTAIQAKPIADKIAYNTLSTPRGGQYKILLPDGTKVWLNAASRITYPTVFTGNDREVSIKGEVYFEVAHNAAKPFIVKTDNNMQVRVLGTHFDVNAYSDENIIKTTLLEGSVKVTSASDEQMLKPGEQMQLSGNGRLKVVKDVDMESIMGWKEGVFNFNDADITFIMRQLSRWYDIDVVYNGAMPKDLFTAIISRNNNISQVLSMLESTLRVHFNIQNRTIYVSN